MPASATITAFYNFTANTKARASQANSNFGVFRGHIIPVDPNTAASANATYDLGSSEWRWRNLYLKSDAGTTTAIAGGFGLSSKLVSASFNTYTSTPISGTTVTISTTGRPVLIQFIPAVADGTDSYIGVNGITTTSDIVWRLNYMKDGITIGSQVIHEPPGAVVTRSRSPGSFSYVDFATAGTYNYSVNANMFAGTAAGANFLRCHLFVREL